jgi:CSLREA domain-containing protein
MPRPQLDPWGNPLPTGRWPAPWVERTTESLGPVIVVDTTVDVVAIDGSCSLREAIDNANAGADTSGGDCTVATTITFDPATDGIPIVLGGAADEDNNASGDLDIAVGLTLLGNGRDLTILDGDQNDRVLHVLSSADTFALEGIEVRNGRPPAERGGGLLVGAHSALRDCRLRDNEALEVGGGVARRRWVWVGPPWCPRGPSSGSTPTRSSSVAPPSEQPVALGIQ